MKYIRTKDGIFEVYFVKDNGVNIGTKAYFETKDKSFFLHDFIPNEKIIKQADTIEELCDEFVWVTPEGEHHIKPKTGDGLWYLCCDYKKGHQIYGAIWTDKGLIYVAKMNDKGELELL